MPVGGVLYAAGSTGVLTEIYDRLADIHINVKDEPYNGTGSGSSTSAADIVAVQAAIDAANSAGGGKVYIPPGTWYLTGIRVKSNVELYGDRNGTKLVLPNSTAGNILEAVSVSNVRIHDLDLDGNEANNTDPGNSLDSQGCNISCWNVENIEIDHVSSHDAIFHGIFVREATGASSKISVHHNTLYSNGYRAVHIHGSDTVSIQNVDVSHNVCYENGAQVGAGDLNSGIFVVFANMKDITVSDNIVHDEVGFGICVQGSRNSSPDTTPAKRAQISGNIVNDCGHAGIFVSFSVLKCVISNNISAGNGTVGISIAQSNSASAAVDIRDLIVTGNQFVDNSGYGFQLGVSGTGYTHGIKQVLIQGNVIAGNNEDGIHGFNTITLEQVSIKDNVIESNAGEAIYLDGSGYSIKSLKINENHSKNNTTGFLKLWNASKFRIRENVSLDDTPASSGNVDQIALVGCSSGIIADNEISAVGRTNSGKGITCDATSDKIEFRRNKINGLTGTPISYLGTNQYTQDMDLVEELVQPAHGYTVPRLLGLSGTTTLTAGTALMCLIRCRRSFTATGIKLFCSTTVANSTDLRVALYDVTFQSRLAQSADLGNPTANTVVSGAFAASYAVTEDTWYWGVVASTGITAGAFRGLNMTSSANVPSVNSQAIAQAFTGYSGGNIAAPITGNSANGFLVLMELY